MYGVTELGSIPKATISRCEGYQGIPRDTKGYRGKLHGQHAELDSKIRVLGPDYLFT
jgi:hypothetical protein